MSLLYSNCTWYDVRAFEHIIFELKVSLLIVQFDDDETKKQDYWRSDREERKIREWNDNRAKFLLIFKRRELEWDFWNIRIAQCVDSNL